MRDGGYLSLIKSDRVSARTREVLLERGRADDPAYLPKAISVDELAVLRAVVDRVLPQDGSERIDLAARIDLQLTGPGDGWRYDELPDDAAAYRAGLRRLEHEATVQFGSSFVALGTEQKDALLRAAATGEVGGGEPQGRAAGEREARETAMLSATQMRLWFEEVRADAAKCYVGHPATLARLGYSGIADGADSETMRGFVQIGMGERESWEPEARGAEPKFEVGL